MSEDVVLAVDSASEADATAVSEPPVVETPESETPETPPERLFKQSELDEIVSKRLARERRVLEREFLRRQEQPPAPQAPVTPEQFESSEAYVDALAEQRANEKLARREAEAQRTSMLEAHEDRAERAREKYADFDAVVENPLLPVSTAMAETLMASEISDEIAYFLGTNPNEAKRIHALPPLLQAREIGKLEAKLIAEPPAKKTSSAPAPITPVRSPGGHGKVFDTTDPRSVDAMSTSEWIEAENRRVMRKAEARTH